MNYIRNFFYLFSKYPIFSLGFLIIITILGIFAPLISPYNPYVADTRARLQPPGVVSGKLNVQNFDLVKSDDQVSQKPRWQQILDLENPDLEKKVLPLGHSGVIDFKMGPNSNFVDVNRNGNYLDEIVFDKFSNCLGLSQNECPEPKITFTKIYKKDSLNLKNLFQMV